MKDLSFFLIKNSLGAKMRKGFRSFCNGDGSTSTLNQRTNIEQYGNSPGIPSRTMAPESPYNFSNDASRESQLPTLEEMILQLELEEKMNRAKRAKLDDINYDDYGGRGFQHHRMSCVNSSDILRTARNALNQYPRFSLDGKDAMYRSSFRNLASEMNGGCRTKSIHCKHDLGRKRSSFFEAEAEKTKCFPAQVAGENVVWCKPGVVAKLMGLEAMPIPVDGKKYYNKSKSKNRVMINSEIKKQNLIRRAQRNEIERRRNIDQKNGWMSSGKKTTNSCSSSGYCFMKPIEREFGNEEFGLPIRRFL